MIQKTNGESRSLCEMMMMRLWRQRVVTLVVLLLGVLIVLFGPDGGGNNGEDEAAVAPMQLWEKQSHNNNKNDDNNSDIALSSDKQHHQEQQLLLDAVDADESTGDDDDSNDDEATAVTTQPSLSSSSSLSLNDNVATTTSSKSNSSSKNKATSSAWKKKENQKNSSPPQAEEEGKTKVSDNDNHTLAKDVDYWNAIACPSHAPTKNGEDVCDLTNPKYGTPVLLISLGRSGSSVTWDTLASLAQESNVLKVNMTLEATTTTSTWQSALERTGNGIDSNLELLNRYPDEHGKCWLQGVTCQLQFENRRRGGGSVIFGTKFKPFEPVLQHPRVQQALEWLEYAAANQSDCNGIKVVYNQRNPLDVAISKIKHLDLGKALPNHCKDIKCQERAANVAGMANYQIDTKRLYKSIVKNVRFSVLIQEYLARIPHVQVQYERLYSNAAGVIRNETEETMMVREWHRVLRFVGATDVADRLTSSDQIHAHIQHVATHPEQRNQSVSNYAEVAKMLEGTEYEDLLYYP